MPHSTPIRLARTTAITSGLLLATALSACASGGAATEPGSAAATVQLAWLANVQNMGPYVAQEEGYYEEADVDVELVPGGPSTTVEPLVVSGNALVGVANLDSVARAVAEGADLTVVGGVIQRNPQSVVSLADEPVETLDDLVGKRMCIQNAGQTTFETILDANGIDPASITFVTADVDPAPLVSGECDAFLGYTNNQPITLELAGVGAYDFTLDEYGYNLWTNVMFVRSDSLEDEGTRAAIAGVLEATQRGWATALEDTDAAAALMVEGPGASLNLDLQQQELSAAAFVPLVRTDETAASGLLTMSDAAIAANIATLETIGVTADTSLFDASLLPAD